MARPAPIFFANSPIFFPNSTAAFIYRYIYTYLSIPLYLSLSSYFLSGYRTAPIFFANSTAAYIYRCIYTYLSIYIYLSISIYLSICVSFYLNIAPAGGNHPSGSHFLRQFHSGKANPSRRRRYQHRFARLEVCS